MKKLRYLYLGITIIFAVGFSVPSTMVFAETKEVIEESTEENIDSEAQLPPVAILSYNPGF
ncbi:hypothetical protein IIZ77_01120, partial [Candidatus Saccharibacteria bacterium]|nr:hypothetical protein [Candidatus Saccharibacteria bacterium]